ncbi:MAG TPA: AraC family transcriptional regulator [Micromonosporaceae bacterium]|jgi:AraC-like DNA-binding protein
MGYSRQLASFAGGGLGEFACPPSAEAWDVDVRQECVHVIAFPGTPVWIRFAGAEPILADRGQVMLHRAGQVYQRSSVAGRGDYCRFIHLTDATAREITAEFDPASASASTFRFSARHTGIPAGTYAAFRTATSAALADGDPVRLAEACYHAARIVAGTAVGAPVIRTAQRDLVEAAKCMIGSDLGREWALADIAGALHVSPYHLTRAFRRTTGIPLHRYLTDARLRAALDLLLDDEATVTSVAYRFGFASHAHFSTSFRGLFGMTPTAARRAGKPRKILEAVAAPAL